MDPVPAVLLDANLLVLLAVGQFDRTLIGRKRLGGFAPADFDRLGKLTAGYTRTITTPHILAEVSNLADQCVPKRRHRRFREFFAVAISTLDERWIPAIELSQTAEFRQLGLADAAVAHLANKQMTVISIDRELCGALWGRGVNAQDFNRLRQPSE